MIHVQCSIAGIPEAPEKIGVKVDKERAGIITFTSPSQLLEVKTRLCCWVHHCLQAQVQNGLSTNQSKEQLYDVIDHCIDDQNYMKTCMMNGIFLPKQTNLFPMLFKSCGRMCWEGSGRPVDGDPRSCTGSLPLQRRTARPAEGGRRGLGSRRIIGGGSWMRKGKGRQKLGD